MTSWPNYCNDAKVWLPMTSAAHDAGNVRTLDVSGNGLHYRFGDGSTAGTFPTKLSGQRGYSFDGSNDYLEALANQTNAITEGTWAVFLSYISGDADFISHWDGTRVRMLLNCFGASMAFFCGDILNPASFLMSNVPRNQSILIAGRLTDDGYRRLYVGGINATPNNTGTTTPSITVTTNPRLGLRYSGIRPFNGRIFWHGHWEYALTEIQLRDLEARLRREYNNV